MRGRETLELQPESAQIDGYGRRGATTDRGCSLVGTGLPGTASVHTSLRRSVGRSGIWLVQQRSVSVRGPPPGSPEGEGKRNEQKQPKSKGKMDYPCSGEGGPTPRALQIPGIEDWVEDAAVQEEKPGHAGHYVGRDRDPGRESAQPCCTAVGSQAASGPRGDAEREHEGHHDGIDHEPAHRDGQSGSARSSGARRYSDPDGTSHMPMHPRC